MREADDLTTFTCQMSWKSGSLNLLEPSGPHRACYGTQKMVHIYIYIYIYIWVWGSVVVKALRCWSDGSGIDPRWSLRIFSVVPSDKTMCPDADSASENEYQGFLLG